jgi:NADH-quinone oxidoreductase subunit M
MIASVALPLTNGFVGEFMLLYGLYEYNHWLAVTGGLTIILGAVYMLRMYQKVMLGESVMENMSFPDLLWNEKVVLISIAVLIFFFGLYPKAILELSEPAVNFIIEKSLIK